MILLDIPETPQGVQDQALFAQLLLIYNALHKLALEGVSVPQPPVVTTEVLAADATVKIDIDGKAYKLLAVLIP